MNLTPEQFAYWLQGRMEDRNLDEQPLSTAEQKMIQTHLAKVFTKVTPLFDSSRLTGILAPVKSPSAAEDTFPRTTFIC